MGSPDSENKEISLIEDRYSQKELEVNDPTRGGRPKLVYRRAGI